MVKKLYWLVLNQVEVIKLNTKNKKVKWQKLI
jgi:hypothetical protein